MTENFTYEPSMTLVSDETPMEGIHGTHRLSRTHGDKGIITPAKSLPLPLLFFLLFFSPTLTTPFTITSYDYIPFMMCMLSVRIALLL